MAQLEALKKDAGLKRAHERVECAGAVARQVMVGEAEGHAIGAGDAGARLQKKCHLSDSCPRG